MGFGGGFCRGVLVELRGFEISFCREGLVGVVGGVVG